MIDMFNKKLKQKIASLEEEILITKRTFEKRLWILENPPKYKVGQKTKTSIITDVYVVADRLTYSGWLPSFFQTPNETEPVMYRWVYKEVNTKTGKTLTI